MILTDELLARVHESLREEPGTIDARRISRIAQAHGLILDRAGLLELTDQVRHHLEGLGPLHTLAAEGVSDILVNPDGSVWVDSAHGLERTDLTLTPRARRVLSRPDLPRSGTAASTTRCRGPMRSFPATSASTVCSPRFRRAVRA